MQTPFTFHLGEERPQVNLLQLTGHQNQKKKKKKSNKLIKVEIFSYLSVMILQVFGNLIYLVFEAYSPHLLSVLFLQSCLESTNKRRQPRPIDVKRVTRDA